MTKDQIKDEIIRKYEELVKSFGNCNCDICEKANSELVSLKSQLAEAWEEKKIDQNCANCKYNNLKSYLEPCNTCKMSYTNWQPR